jgi:hypothetical protein
MKYVIQYDRNIRKIILLEKYNNNELKIKLINEEDSQNIETIYNKELISMLQDISQNGIRK